MRHVPAAPRPSDALTLIAGTWLASGCVLLGLTPLPWHDATFGWAPAFWLLAAPCLLLVARAACARQGARTAAAYGRRECLARTSAYPMPMASRVRPRARPRLAGVTPRTPRPAQRVG